MGKDKKRNRKGGRKFAYKSRDSSMAKDRAEKGGGDFDKIFKENIDMFSPAADDNLIRPLPPTWDEAEHYGYDIYVHYGIGADNQAYLCRKKMLNEACPICEASKEAEREGDSEYAKDLKAKQRVAFFLVDRDNEDKGALMWSSPWGFDKDVCKISVDKRTGEVLALDHPEEGYDIEFEKTGAKMRTKYEGIKIARNASELDNDEALDFIAENPIPDTLNFYSYEHIEDVFGGGDGASKKDEEEPEEEDEKPSRKSKSKSRRKDSDEDEDEDAPDYEYDDLVEMSKRKLKKVAIETDLEDDDIEDMDADELLEAICAELDIDIPEEDAPEEEPEEEDEKPAKKKRGNKKLADLKSKRAKKR